MNNGTITFIIIAALVLFAIFRRARALFTRQKIRQESMMLRLGIFGVLGVVVLALSLTDSLILLGDLAGLVAGAVVAYFGLRLTTFDRQPDGLYYKPNPYIGIAVFAVFLVRFGYRLIETLPYVQTVAQQARSGGAITISSQFAGDPITGASYFLMIGYYVFYYVTLILRARQPDTVS